ncbi:hypothetical protein CP985_05770 [Malaciobacter mytili LMG 24559]|uniref:Uncharacterized protein n=1 Tax=Malaciobacter mytili LMG 24559 TaxID=1032238 RepID=A0AAX2AGF4_9BACT|nr:hypothetical protein [Malaciobacter mytili]AXH14342.1 hypothetical protein AMYT_0749 [Malaciobacter mytili LMG 24559]RXK16082.1 hypothetical protein CP985_05770 [Malaciobacter mytili LMG 24559]
MSNYGICNLIIHVDKDEEYVISQILEYEDILQLCGLPRISEKYIHNYTIKVIKRGQDFTLDCQLKSYNRLGVSKAVYDFDDPYSTLEQHFFSAANSLAAGYDHTLHLNAFNYE